MRKLSFLFLAALSLLAALPAAGLTLNRSFGNHMVVQRDKPVVVRGTAEPGVQVNVRFAGQTGSATADAAGIWKVALAALPADSTPQDMVVAAGGATITLSDVLVGDVFLHARQSSIDLSLGRDEAGAKRAASDSDDPLLRAITIKMIPTDEPRQDLAAEATAGWAMVAGDSALALTDSAYYLGRELARDSDVPIGIVDLKMGPAFAQSWLSRDALMATERFFTQGTRVGAKVERKEAMLEAERKGEKFHRNDKGPPENMLEHPLFPYAGYRGTLLPLAETAFKAVILQLGNDYPYMKYQQLLDSDDPFCSDALDVAYKDTYNLRKDGFSMESKIVPRVTQAWRDLFGDKDLPFGLIVPPGSDLNTLALHHREMRELQRLVAEDNEGVGVILPGTEHIPLSAQPADAALLGKRCQSWIAGAVYQKPGRLATGPQFERFEADYNEATIYFKEGSAKGLKAEGDALAYFEAANVQGDYSPVNAEIDGETIRIQSDSVTRIARVRYNWNHLPNQGLTNADGLAAMPFRSERPGYEWFFRNEEDDLPEEYFTPANEWGANDITLINVAMQGRGYENFSGWVGPAGFNVGPFGPNMGVREIKEGSPADGKLQVGDVIFSANGNMLGDKAWLVMAAAITESEKRQGKGKLHLGVRRGSENIEVELTLPVMGTYSSTAPYDCPKTEKIVAQLEEWMASGEFKNDPRVDFLGTDTLFLLATGNPELLGLARRAIYKKMAETQIVEEIDPTKGPRAWYPAWDSLLLGEYYMATGDRNVLPYLKFNLDLLAAKQHPKGSWRHNFPGGDNYGLMPALGVAAAIGFHLGNDAGLDISQEAYRKVVQYHYNGSGEMGRIIYGVGAGNIAAPRELDPEVIKNGMMATSNGALAAAAILFQMEGYGKAAHLNSYISAHAWNNTFDGHGGNFWNNFWTPLGAKVHGEKTFIHFWENYRWYRELGRMHGGALNFDGFKDCAGFGIPLVAPRERLQIVGAPPSPFAADAPAMLKPALAAYWKKDYAEAEKLANDLIGSGSVGVKDLPTVEYLARAAKEMQESIAADLRRMYALIDDGDPAAAQKFLPGLSGVVAPDDARLVAIRERLEGPFDLVKKSKKNSDAPQASEEKARQWACLVMQTEEGDSRRGAPRGPLVESPPQPSVWKLKVIESMKHAPEGWSAAGFDDSAWRETTLPKSWRLYHTALLRTDFQVDDKSRFDALRLHSWVLRQQEMEIYLNGTLIAKVNGTGNSTHIEEELKASAFKHLKTGTNSLAIKTRHNWRWGHGALRVYNNGFDFNLDARLKP
ncbi:MAG: DUF6288 domain-containing protein [Opitutales bacterium]